MKKLKAPRTKEEAVETLKMVQDRLAHLRSSEEDSKEAYHRLGLLQDIMTYEEHVASVDNRIRFYEKAESQLLVSLKGIE